jgi:NUMOD3 motif
MQHHRYLLRLAKHWSRHLQSAWAKYGATAFVFEIVEIVEDANFILPREQCWIWRENAHKAGYNTLEKPDRLSGFKHSPESLAKMRESQRVSLRLRSGWTWNTEARTAASVARRGKKLSPERNRRKSEWQTGKKKSPEARRRMSIAQKTVFANGREPNRVEWTPELRERQRLNQLGRKRSDEARQRMSAAHLGKKLPPEQVAKIANANRGRKMTPEQNAAKSEYIKKWWAQRKAAQS